MIVSSGPARGQSTQPPAPAITGSDPTPAVNAATSTTVITPSDSAQTPRALGTLLDGRAPGATIESSTSDAPGEGLKMQLRGVTSINGADDPLYVVDGVFAIDQPMVDAFGTLRFVESNGMNRIGDIAPSDIASIEVLKGAAATASYGAKAAAGAVIITTKHGSSTRAIHWELDGQVGHAVLANELPIRAFPTLQSAQAWYINDVTRDTTPSAISKDRAFIQSLYAGPQNYQSELFGNPQVSDLTRLSVDGTLASTQYYLSALSTYTNGVALHAGDLAQSVRGNVTQHLGSFAAVTANLSYMDDETHQGGFTAGAGPNPYQVITETPGFLDLNHPMAGGAWPTNPFGGANPFADLVLGSAPAQTTRFMAGGSVQVTPWQRAHQGVQIVLSGGVDRANLHAPVSSPSSLEPNMPALGGSSVTNTGRIAYANYGVTLTHHYGGAAVDATTTLGYETDVQTNADTGRTIDSLPPGYGGPSGSDLLERTSAQQHAFSVQEQVITLASRLSLTAGVTAMSSTLNGNAGEFYPYPHYAASYRIVHPATWIDEIKLRAAYGEAGDLPPYGARYTLLNTPCIIIESIGCGPATRPPLMKPETERESELGFDVPLFRARLQLSATVYTKNVSDLVLAPSVASSEGASTVFLNGGSVTNSGAELQLQAVPVDLRNGFTWTTATSFYRDYSVVDALATAPFAMNETLEGVLGATDYVAVGRSLTEIVAPGQTGPGGLPRQVGDVMPDWQMSFAEAVSFRRVRLFALADWSRGGTAIDLESYLLDFANRLSGDSALTARRTAGYFAGRIEYVESASYFTLRELGLSYDLPDAVLRRVGFGRITGVRISLTGYDLWSGFGYKGLDPQAEDFGAALGGVGFESIPYPPARSYYVGLHLSL